ncbi:HD domain-containing protein [Candidatus Ruminimicrobium bovinum]|uniref:HD domain-containing protein n=1 Tax=Candidatus Ruminimicrobium bovinum TaxID=3242779 RepID=UPI0039B8EB91
MITKSLIEKIFSAANIMRWNDHIRPFDFFELDKQAHKMIIAYMIAKFDEQFGKKINWIKLIEGGIFEFLQRVVLTDLKPEVYHEIMSQKKDELNGWVLSSLSSDVVALGNGFYDRLEKYLFDNEESSYEKKILKASHEFSTRWEFGIIYPWNKMLYGIEKTRETVDTCVVTYKDFIGIKELIMNKKYYGFLDLCGQLRFQQRWAQTFRQPRTNVLGHMFVVAVFAYLYSLDMDICSKRYYNNFFSSLFHDLPEILTKDIVSPVKSSVKGLEEIIKEYEKKQIEERILPLLPDNWHFEMEYFIENEFINRIIKDSKITEIAEITDEYNDDKFCPVDGKLIEVCDKLSAYIEASLALRYGIHSGPLNKAKERLYEKFANVKIANLSFKEVFDYFN